MARDDEPRGAHGPVEAAMRIRVAIVEDFPLMREALAESLGRDPGIEIVGTAEDGEAGRELVLEVRPDVLICDLSLPELDGVSLLREVRRHAPQVRTLVLSARERATSVLDAVAAGAHGYLTKRSSAEQIRQAVITVHGGGSVISPQLAGYLLTEYADRTGGAPDGPPVRPLLSDREQSVLRLVAQGRTDREIGEELYIAPRTVQNHLASIRRKTGRRRRSELARWAADHARV